MIRMADGIFGMTDILVLGGAHIDRRGRISGETVPGASQSRHLEGGSRRRRASIARAASPGSGIAVTLISPRGGDAEGEAVAAAAESAGVIDRPFTFLDRRTPSYTAIMERDGNLVIALADMDLYRFFSPGGCAVRQVRDQFDDAAFILTDANLPAETLGGADRSGRRAEACRSPQSAFRRQRSCGSRICSTGIDYLFMNEAEARALTGETPDGPSRVARDHAGGRASGAARSRVAAGRSSPGTRASQASLAAAAARRDRRCHRRGRRLCRRFPARAGWRAVRSATASCMAQPRRGWRWPAKWRQPKT